LEVLTKKSIKSKGIMLKTFRNICFWEKKFEKQTKFATHMDL